MDLHLAELAVLYEIASFNFCGSGQGFFFNLVTRTVRLFGAGRVVLALQGETGLPVVYAWGFPGFSPARVEAVLDYVRRNGMSAGVYRRELDGDDDSSILFFMERERAFESHERRLLDILAGRVAELVQARRREGRLVSLSTRDALTGCFNRAYFEDKLRWYQKNKRDFPVSLMVCDLNGLKVVNDTLGHEQGDEILRRAAAVVTGSVRGSDIVARVGGDEFAVVLPRADRAVAEAVARRIAEAVKNDNGEHPGLLLGISVGTATAETPEQLLVEAYSEADDAMYQDKLANGADARGAAVRVLKAALAERDGAAAWAKQVKKLAYALGEAVGLAETEMARLCLLADVHDIGRVVLPDGFCLGAGDGCGGSGGAGAGCADERELLEKHAEAGYRIAVASAELAPIAELIRRQHAWWNGEGYPHGLAGEDISILNRILAVAVAFARLTHGLEPGDGAGRAAALSELEKDGGVRFDPRLLTYLADALL